MKTSDITPLEERVDHLHSAVRAQTPWMAEMGFQYVGFDPNNPVARFSDKSDSLPMVIEYTINNFGQHMFRITIRTFGMGIQMATPWVTSGKDTFDPRLKRMRFYVDVLRAAGTQNVDC